MKFLSAQEETVICELDDDPDYYDVVILKNNRVIESCVDIETYDQAVIIADDMASYYTT